MLTSNNWDRLQTNELFKNSYQQTIRLQTNVMHVIDLT